MAGALAGVTPLPQPILVAVMAFPSRKSHAMGGNQHTSRMSMLENTSVARLSDNKQLVIINFDDGKVSFAHANPTIANSPAQPAHPAVSALHSPFNHPIMAWPAAPPGPVGFFSELTYKREHEQDDHDAANLFGPHNVLGPAPNLTIPQTIARQEWDDVVVPLFTEANETRSHLELLGRVATRFPHMRNLLTSSGSRPNEQLLIVGAIEHHIRIVFF